MANSSPPTSEKTSVYDSLPTPTSIRLLTILPGGFGDVIQCRLNVFEFENAPPYEALSYVWGVITPPTFIICNGMSVGIGPNLSAALQRLRYSRVSDSAETSSALKSKKQEIRQRERRIWIDALCINQADLEERSHQVSFMKDIFNRAENVMVWLGEANEHTLKAVSLIQKVARIAYKELDYTNLEFPVIPIGNIESRDDLPAPSHLDWEPVYLFYEIAWFRRVWVTQEVARENACMIIGGDELPWVDVARCSQWLNNRGYARTWERIQSLYPVRGIHHLRKGASLYTLLKVTSKMEATDPRDRIYALLGLYSMWAAQGSIPPPSFKPDYKETVIKVYGDVVRYLITRPTDVPTGEGSLRVLLRNERYTMNDMRLEDPLSDDSDDFPTWIPCWDKIFPTWVSFGDKDCTRHWSPGLDSKISIGKHSNDASLVLKGIKITAIMSLEHDFELTASRLSTDNSLVRSTLEKAKQKTSKYVGEGALKEAFASALTAGQSKVDGKSLPFHSEDLEKYLTSEQNKEECSHFADSISFGRTLSFTDSGHMGLGSRKMQPGDEICLLFGGEVLFILRPVGEHYTLVGECYVHGLMQGEAMEQWKAGELKDQWFELR